MAVYLATAVTLEWQKDVLGMWVAKTEGAKFWLQVVTELKDRRVKDIFITKSPWKGKKRSALFQCSYLQSSAFRKDIPYDNSFHIRQFHDLPTSSANCSNSSFPSNCRPPSFVMEKVGRS
jgi:hypothetical protein